jgi:hypothetical protein
MLLLTILSIVDIPEDHNKFGTLLWAIYDLELSPIPL